MSDWMDVDIALASVPVNSMPLVDDTDFKTIEDAVVYNQAGLALFWNFTTTAGVKTVTAVTPTTAGDYDWTDFTTSGMYGIEIPASGGASINNDAEGFGYFTGVADGILPWRGPTIGFRDAAINNLMIDVPLALTNFQKMYDETGYLHDTGPSSRSQVAVIGAGGGGGALPYEVIADNESAAIKGISAVGAQTGTFANTEAEDGVLHTITHAGNAFDRVYRINVTGTRTGVQILWAGYIDGNNDTAAIQVYDFAGVGWDTVKNIGGQNGSANLHETIPILTKHTGTGADLGDVLIRFVTSGQTSPVLHTDQLLINAVPKITAIGFEGGAVWINTVAGTSGTGEGVGFIERPSDNITDALAIAAANNLKIIHSLPGSSHILAASVDGIEFKGFSYSVDLSDESVSGALFDGATITGNDDGSNAIATVYRNCIMGSNTLGLHILESPTLTGDMVLAEAGSYLWKNPKSFIAGGGAPSVDFQSAAETKALNVRGIFGGLEIKNYNAGGGTHTMTLGGTGQRIFNASCAGGTLEQRGQFKETDNAGGAVTVVRDKLSQDAIDILDDTGTSGVLLSAAATSAQLVDDTWDEDMSGHNTGGTTGKYLRQIKEGVVVAESTINDASATATTFITNLTEAVSSFWADLTMVIIDGALKGQSKPIKSYDGGTKTIVVDEAFTSAPADGVGFIITSTHVHPVSQIADGVLDELLTGHTTADSLGKAVTDILEDTGTTIPGILGTPTAGDLATDIANVQAEADAITVAIAALNDLSAAQVNAEVVDALATDTYAEPSSVPLATASLATKIGWMQAVLRNELNQTATTLEVRNDGDSAAIGTATVSDDGTTAVRGEFA